MLRVRSILTGVAGTPWYQNHYFVGDDDAAEAQTAVTDVLAYWAGLDGLMDNAITITVEGEVPHLSSSTGEIDDVFAVTGGTQQGDSSGLPMPYQTQGLITWSTGLFIGGRRLTGRSYVPGLTVDNLEADGTPSSGSISGMQAAGEILRDSDAGFVVWSRTHGVASAVLNVVAEDKWAFLASRRD